MIGGLALQDEGIFPYNYLRSHLNYQFFASLPVEISTFKCELLKRFTSFYTNTCESFSSLFASIKVFKDKIISLDSRNVNFIKQRFCIYLKV